MCGLEWNNAIDGKEIQIGISGLSMKSSANFMIHVHLCHSCSEKYAIEPLVGKRDELNRKTDESYLRQKEVELNIRTNIKDILNVKEKVKTRTNLTSADF